LKEKLKEPFVEASNFNQHIFKMLGYWATIFSLISLVALHMAVAGDTQQKPKKINAEKNNIIHITSDKLISYNKGGYAEFIGNVTATQKETVITADRIKVIFKKDIANTGSLSVNEESISEIIANGNVKIKIDNRVAVTQQAVYNTQTKVLVLTGDGSSITSGKNTISGEKITFYRADGRLNVESGSKKRVDAVFYSGQQDRK
jgi:lipopolysaccharide export system protein LptA